jgi:hypothetical protein
MTPPALWQKPSETVPTVGNRSDRRKPFRPSETVPTVGETVPTVGKLSCS